MLQAFDAQRLNMCPLPASAVDTYTPVNIRLGAVTPCPPTPCSPTTRVRDGREKSKGGRKSVFAPIRETPDRRKPLPHNTFRRHATTANREISISEQETDRQLPRSARLCRGRCLLRTRYERTTRSRIQYGYARAAFAFGPAAAGWCYPWFFSCKGES